MLGSCGWGLHPFVLSRIKELGQHYKKRKTHTKVLYLLPLFDYLNERFKKKIWTSWNMLESCETPESMWIYYNRKPVTVSKSQPLCLSLRGKYSKYLTIKNSSSREIVYSTGYPRSSLDREKRAEGSHTCKTHEPLSIYPEGSPACALICRLAALLDCWRLEGSHWICWSPRKTGQMRCVCWFNGIPRGSVPHASPHLWASGLRGYCCPASSGFNVWASACVFRPRCVV